MDTKHEALELAAKLDPERESEFKTIKYSTAAKAAALIRHQHARIEELERMLERCTNAIYDIGGEHVTGLGRAQAMAEQADALLTKKD